MKSFTYMGIDVYPMSPNSMGLRYQTSLMGNDLPRLRADTKAGIKAMIRGYLKK